MQPPSPFPPAPRRSRGPLIALVAGILLVLAALVVAGVILRSGDSKPKTLRPRTPLAFREVAGTSPAPCPTPGPDVAADDKQCYRLGGGFTATQFSAVRVVGPDAQHTGFTVQIRFNAADTKSFADLTGRLANRQPSGQIAMVQGAKVISAPTVQSAITGGSVEISGVFTRTQAETLAHQLSGT